MKLLLFFLLLTALTSGCGNDTIQDATNRQRDRDRESASLLEEDYNKIAGEYHAVAQGPAPSAATVAKMKAKGDVTGYYKVGASIRVSHVVQNGSVPQPVLTGRFHMEPLVQLDGDQADTTKHLPFSNGIYDSGSKNFAVHLPGYGTQGADISCKFQEPNLLQCQWNPVTAGNPFEFTMAK